MPLEKEFGKLSLDQFRRIVRKLPEVRGQMKELTEVVRTTPKEKVEEILDKDFYWAEVYELIFEEHLALLFLALGKAKELMALKEMEDPQEGLMRWFDEEDDEDWSGGEGGQFQKKHVVGLTVALQRTILSIMLYHRPISALVQIVKTGEDDADEAFFKAVRVDRSVLSCPTFSDRLAKAELTNDKTFFLHLRSAVKGPSKKHWEALYDLRYALCMLRELGFDQMSDAQLEDLLVHKLKLYPNAPGARKNLRKQFTESKRAQPPQNQFSGGRFKTR